MVSHSMFTFASNEHSPFVYTMARNLPEEEPSTDSIISSSSSSSSSSSTLSASPVPQSLISNSESTSSSFNTSDSHSSFGICSSPPPTLHRLDSSSTCHPPTPRSRHSPQLGIHRHSTTRSDSLGLSAFRPASEIIVDLPGEEQRRLRNYSSPGLIQPTSGSSDCGGGGGGHGDRLISISEPNHGITSNDDDMFWGQATMTNTSNHNGHCGSNTREATTSVSRQHTLTPPTNNACRRCGSSSSLSSSLSSASFSSSLSSSLPSSAPPTQSTLVSPFSLSFFAASSAVSAGTPASSNALISTNHYQDNANSRYQSLENSLNQTFSSGQPTLGKTGYSRSRHNSSSGCSGNCAASSLANGVNGFVAVPVGNISNLTEPAIHLRPGDLVEIDRTLYAHWALYVGGGQVVHIVDEHSNQDLPIGSWGLVKRDALTSVAGSSFVRANNKEVPAKERLLVAHSPTEVVQNALRMVGKLVPYNTLTRNSEHYLTEWKYGKAWSDQVSNSIFLFKFSPFTLVCRHLNLLFACLTRLFISLMLMVCQSTHVCKASIGFNQKTSISLILNAAFLLVCPVQNHIFSDTLGSLPLPSLIRSK